MPIRSIKFAMLLSIQGILWFAAVLAQLGKFFGGGTFTFPFNFYGIILFTIVLVLWVSMLVLLCEALSIGKRRWIDILPAFLIGNILPITWFVPYTVLLATILFYFIPAIICTKENLPDENLAGKNPEFPDAPQIFPLHENIIEPASESLGEENEENETASDENMTQRIVRYAASLESPVDRFEGLYRIKFREDEQTVSIHVPFCPPFSAPPSIDVQFLETTGAKFQVFEPKSFGVRIDVKRKLTERNPLDLLVIAESKTR